MKKIKFAVVREDPILEASVIKKYQAKNILLIASGGCIALSLQKKFPDIKITLFDINLAQIEHVKDKLTSLKNFYSYPLKYFNIGADDNNAINGKGQFEQLFRSFRFFINEFIVHEQNLKRIFLTDTNTAQKIIKQTTSNKYWQVAFESYFSDSMLVTMFGKEAIQHAKSGSYPKYFQTAIEVALQQDNIQTNYFLQHILLGYYLNSEASLPYYLSNVDAKIENNFTYIHSDLLNINLSNYDLISLSNIFDWTQEQNINAYLDYLHKNLMKTAHVITRQLNNYNDYFSLNNNFIHDRKLENEVTQLDRSIFYNKINIISKKQ